MPVDLLIRAEEFIAARRARADRDAVAMARELLAETRRLRALVATPPKPALAATVGDLGMAAMPATMEVDDAH